MDKSSPCFCLQMYKIKNCLFLFSFSFHFDSIQYTQINFAGLDMFKFIISGGSATVAHLSVMAFLVWIGVNPLISTSTGVIVGAIVNYILQYYYTFDANIKHKKSVRNYIITVSLSFISNFIIFWIFHNLIGVEVLIAQLLTSGIVAIQNYVVYKNFVFLREGGIYEA